MKKLRLPTLSWWLAGTYFLASLAANTVARSTLLPLLLYLLIFPWSFLYVMFLEPVLESWIKPDPGSQFITYIGLAFYLVAGTLWFWILGRVASRLFTWLVPIKNQETEGLT